MEKIRWNVNILVNLYPQTTGSSSCLEAILKLDKYDGIASVFSRLKKLVTEKIMSVESLKTCVLKDYKRQTEPRVLKSWN